jgi:nicotinate phosphoribosyltransferase
MENDHSFISQEDLPLFEPTATFSYCQVLLKQGMQDKIATFDLFVRDMPRNRNFMIFGGLENTITRILNWKFSKSQIDLLKRKKIIKKELAKYLEKFKFNGDIYAMPEGTIFFPGETIIRITAPIIDANLFYAFLLNSVNSHIVFMSKAIRSVIAAEGKIVVSNGGRALGLENGFNFVRSAYLVGISTTLQLSPILKNDIPLLSKYVKSTFHAYIKSFSSEYEAFKAFVDEFPNNEATLMVDTYNFKNGVRNALEICRYLKTKNKKLNAIFVDSGDLHKNCIYAKKQLTQAGFGDVKIIVASNINEWKISELIKKKTPCDTFMAITELVTSSDDPKLEIVYKMAELREGHEITQVMKLSESKQSLPGRKQIFRLYKNGKMTNDIIGLENEKLGKKLLKHIVKQGRLIYSFPEMQKIKHYVAEQIYELPHSLKKLETVVPFNVACSQKLEILINKTKGDIMKKHH